MRKQWLRKWAMFFVGLFGFVMAGVMFLFGPVAYIDRAWMVLLIALVAIVHGVTYIIRPPKGKTDVSIR